MLSIVLAELWDEELRKRKGKPPKSKSKPKKEVSKMPSWEEHVQCPHCPGMYANELMKFVGFRGTLTQGKHPKGGVIELATLDIYGEVHEGEARPAPYVPVSITNEENLMRIYKKTKKELGRLFFLGILDYEVEIMTLKFTLKGMGYSNFLIMMGRGLGKTYMEDWENSVRMKWFAMKILLLSESDAGKDVGDWIHTWAFENKLIKQVDKGSKGQTYLSFTLYNGAKLYVYAYMDKHSLGKHEIQIVGDDIINLDWQNRPTDEKRARKHWHSNLNHMNRIGFDVWGTCKYEGDLLSHFRDVIRDIVIIKQSPFKECPHQPTPNEQGVYNECPICRNDNLLAPQIHSYDEYMDKKEENYDAWYSEQMQNPHRQEGGMVGPQDICYVPRPHWTDDVIMGGTGVDLADTTDVKNDMCGVISCLSHRFRKDKRDVRAFTVYNTDVARRLARNSEVKEKKKPFDWIDHDKDGNEMRIVRGVIETVQIHCDFHMVNYPHIPYIVAWERNKSGIAVMEQALREFRLGAKVEVERGVWVDLTWPAYLIPDKGVGIKLPHSGDVNIKLGINHMGMNKEVRVEGELKYPIINDQIRFSVEQKYTVFMSQLLGFPKARHDDGPDACGMIKDELNRRWQASVPSRKSVAIKKDARESDKYAKDFKRMSEPWAVRNKSRKRII